jgi:hypothetical protein
MGKLFYDTKHDDRLISFLSLCKTTPLIIYSFSIFIFFFFSSAEKVSSKAPQQLQWVFPSA